MVRLGFLAFLTVPLLTGCMSSRIDLREPLDVQRSSFEEKLAGDAARLDRYRACTRQAHDGGSLPLVMTTEASAAQPAAVPMAIGGRLRAPVHALAEQIRQRIGNDTASLHLLSDMADEFADPAYRRLDLDKLRRISEAIRHLHAHLDFDEDALAQDTSLFARLLSAYTRAYFGDLKFAVVPDSAAGTVRGVVQVASRGFVDRSGNTIRFPGLAAAAQIDAQHSVEFAATSVDSRRISADLTRLFLEAFFDAAFRVPAVHEATALRASTHTAPYPAFDASRSPVSPEALAIITRNALRTEAVVTSLTGKAVRGGSLFGTNNETVSATLETAAGVFAKKLVEHEGFCYFQVTQQH